MTFKQYLNSQPVERVRAIRRAERAWLASRRAVDNTQGGWTDVAGAVSRAFEDQMEGYEDPPTGEGGTKSRAGFYY